VQIAAVKNASLRATHTNSVSDARLQRLKLNTTIALTLRMSQLSCIERTQQLKCMNQAKNSEQKQTTNNITNNLATVSRY
jgi:hypothetical protein